MSETVEADPAEGVRAALEALSRRERAVARWRAAARGGWGAGAVIGWALLAPSAGVSRAAAGFWAVLLVGCVVAWAAGPLRGGSGSRPLLRQARRMEQRLPEARGVIVTAAQLAESGAPVGASLGLVGAVFADAARRVGEVPASGVYPVAPAVRRLVAAWVAWCVLLCASFALPVGPGAAVDWWWGPRTAEAAVAEALGGPVARVGDIDLRLVYPDYTGLEPVLLPNSTGDVSGPPGTTVEVRLRSAESVEAVGLEVGGESFAAEVDPDGRTLSGRFAIGLEPSQWRMRTWSEGESRPTRAFTITPEPDLPPEVWIDLAGDRLEVAPDQPLDLGWRARDDFGLLRVQVEIDGAAVGAPLWTADGRRAEVAEQMALRPSALGLHAGQRARLVVAAWDNDTVSGSKVGRSREIEIVVVGGAQRDALTEARREALLQVMLPILARHLVERPVVPTESGAVAAWGEVVGGWYAPLADAVGDAWEDGARLGADQALVVRALDAGRELVRYSQVAFTPGSVEEAAPASVDAAVRLRDAAVVALEDAISSLDALQRVAALARTVARAESLDSDAAELSAALARDADAEGVAARRAAIARTLEEVVAASEGLAPGGLREQVAARAAELRALSAEVERSSHPGTTRAMSQRVAEQARDLALAVQTELDRARAQSDRSMEEAKDLLAELRALEADQRALQQEVQAIREAQDRASAEATADLWREAEALSEALSRHGERYRAALASASRPFYEQERAGDAADASASAARAVAMRDLRGSLAGADRALGAWEFAAATAARETRRGAGGPAAAEAVSGEQQADRLLQVLERLQQQAEQASPEAAAAAAARAEAQRALSERLGEDAKKAQALARDFPVRPTGLEPALEEAGDRMTAAGDDLRRGRPMPAEGSQAVAAERVQAAREALEQAMQSAAQQRREMEGGEGGTSGEEGEPSESESDAGEEGRAARDRKAFELPSREEFLTPEAYRRALLEGMEGDVPEAYRALKRRYYEELVSQ
jgi:hypothetical protein